MSVWLRITQSLPWLEAALSAPDLARQAKSYWHALRQKNGDVTSAADVALSPEIARIQNLEERCKTLEAVVESSAELLDVLAAQNEYCLKEIARLKKYLLWFSAGVGLLLLSLFLLLLAYWAI